MKILLPAPAFTCLKASFLHAKGLRIESRVGLTLTLRSLALAMLVGCVLTFAASAKPLNVLLITSDDMNFDSPNCYGGVITNLTPNIDRLASEGFRFRYAYATVAVCQPVRQTLMTGLYPQRSGSMGFMPLNPEVRTVSQQFHDAGYLISMIGKNPHYQPAEKFCVDVAETQISRSPGKLYDTTRAFLKQAAEQKKPFFHNVNCTDPHRPFVGIRGPDDLAGGDKPSRTVSVDEITSVPGFLENLPEVRRELAGYYTSVRRLDDCVGQILKAIDDAGERGSTFVLFYGGDHGMSIPFAKSNAYENSSRASLILRWPGVAKPGTEDTAHLVSTLDFTPTLLDAASLPPLPDRDGRSFAPLLKGQPLDGWDRVYTVYNQNSAGKWFPMRCVRTRDRAYIWNAWADGTATYVGENMQGLTWSAMVKAAETDPKIRARTQFYLHRVPEELYDLTGDRCERVNLIADPARQTEIEALRADLLATLRRTVDPLAEAFAQRGNPQALQDALKAMAATYDGRREKKNAAAKKAGKGKNQKENKPQ